MRSNLLILSLFLLIFTAPTSWAAEKKKRTIHVCNEVAYEQVYVAYAEKQAQKWISQGWYLIRPGRCMRYRKKNKIDEVYYYAVTQSKRQAWVGEHQHCVTKSTFKFNESSSKETCKSRGGSMKNFKRKELHPHVSTTIILKPNRGGRIKSYKYKDAPFHLLEEWALEGDKKAARWLDHRQIQ